jgi:hypothetical protein
MSTLIDVRLNLSTASLDGSFYARCLAFALLPDMVRQQWRCADWWSKMFGRITCATLGYWVFDTRVS